MKKRSRITHRFGIALAAFALFGLAPTTVSATPSTQIWIPSTDIQPYKTAHFGFDTYVRTKPEANTGGQNVPPSSTSA